MIVDLIKGKIYFLTVFLALPFLFCTQYLPDISFAGKSLTDQDGNTVFQLVCSTNLPSVECTTNFQVDQQTYDDIRFTSNACNHRYGNCSQDICDCSENCQTFTLNISSALGMRNRKFGCESRLKFQSFIFKATASLKLDGNEFVIVEKVVQPIGQVLTSSNILTTAMTSRDPDENSCICSGSTGPSIGFGISCLIFTLGSIVGIYCIWRKLSEKQNANKNRSSVSKRTNVPTEKQDKHIGDTKNTAQHDGKNHDIDVSGINIQEKKTQIDPVSPMYNKTKAKPGRRKYSPRHSSTIDDIVPLSDSSVTSFGHGIQISPIDSSMSSSGHGTQQALLPQSHYRTRMSGASETKGPNVQVCCNMKIIADVPLQIAGNENRFDFDDRDSYI